MVFLRNFPKLGCRTLAVFGLLRWFTFFNWSIETLYGRFAEAPVFFWEEIEKIAARWVEGAPWMLVRKFCLDLRWVLRHFFVNLNLSNWVGNFRVEIQREKSREGSKMCQNVGKNSKSVQTKFSYQRSILFLWESRSDLTSFVSRKNWSFRKFQNSKERSEIQKYDVKVNWK